MRLTEEAMFILLFLFLLPPQLETTKILLISPKFGRSHVHFVGSVADILVEAGFDVTVLLPEMNPLLLSNGTDLAKRIIIPSHPEISKENQESGLAFSSQVWRSQMQNPITIIRLSSMMSRMFLTECEHILTFTEELDRLKNEKFDLAMAEAFEGCPLGLIELLQIPAHIIISPSSLSEYVATNVGVTLFPSYVPGTFTWFTDQMSYGERAINLVFALFMKWFFTAEIFEKENELFKRKFGEQFMDLNEKVAQASFVLTNADPFFDFPRPTLYKVIDLGGLSLRKPKPLDEPWKSLMEQRQMAILVSFGSVARSSEMPSEFKQAFLRAFDQFPNVTFIWKYEKTEDNIADGHENVVTGKWLPQNEILAHPNLIAFITHGGMNSITETAAHGKPLIAIPLFGDQFRNAKTAEHAGYGICLSLDDIQKKDMLVNTIATIINDKKYSMAATKLSQMIAKRPNPSIEQLIRHVKFAAEFGHLPNLDPYGRRMSFISYYMLDIIIPFIMLAIMICTGVLYLLYRLLKSMLFGDAKKSKKE